VILVGAADSERKKKWFYGSIHYLDARKLYKQADKSIQNNTYPTGKVQQLRRKNETLMDYFSIKIQNK